MQSNKCLLLTLLPLLFIVFITSCKKDLNVNADWKEIPVVYSIINQNDSIHYVKVTKAFLGAGDALAFAQIPDSSNYPVADMQVRLEGWQGSNLKQTINFHDTLIQNKDTGIFYSPTQLVYTSRDQLNENYTYKLFIKNIRKNFEITSQTDLVGDFVIEKPEGPPAKVSFLPNKKTPFEWAPAKGGERYGVTMKFHYLEIVNGGNAVEKEITWVIFNNIQQEYNPNAQNIQKSVSGDAFYAFLKGNLIADPSIDRTARFAEFIFTVGSPDFNTYMEVNEPSNTIIQERPAFTNITSTTGAAVGLFASRYDNTKKRPLVMEISDVTLNELRVNDLTKDLNF